MQREASKFGVALTRAPSRKRARRVADDDVVTIVDWALVRVKFGAREQRGVHRQSRHESRACTMQCAGLQGTRAGPQNNCELITRYLAC